MTVLLRALRALCLLAFGVTPAVADPQAPLDESFALLGGRVMHDDNLANGFEDNYILGAAYQRFVLQNGDFRAGVEVGLAGRFGAVSSAELWAGLVARYDFELFDLFRLTPSMTVGVSAVTAPLVGGELERQDSRQGDARLLFYLGPEVAVSLADQPQAEVFVRLHHRSGAWGTLGNMHGAQDAIAAGFRAHF